MTNKVKVTSEVEKLGVWNNIPSDSVNSVKIKFEFAEDWNDLICTAQFTQGENTYNILIEDNECIVPAELTEGEFELSVFGAKSDGTAYRATSVSLVEDIYGSGFVGDGETPIPPTPDLYDQLITKFATSNNYDYIASGVGYTSKIFTNENNFEVNSNSSGTTTKSFQISAVLYLGDIDGQTITPKYRPLSTTSTKTNLKLYYMGTEVDVETYILATLETLNALQGAQATGGASFGSGVYFKGETVYGLGISFRATNIRAEDWEETAETIFNNTVAALTNTTEFVWENAPETLEFTLAEV